MVDNVTRQQDLAEATWLRAEAARLIELAEKLEALYE